MRILVLGGYGLIGLGIVRRLAGLGHDVVGLGRSAEIGKRLYPHVSWVAADMARLVTPADWSGLVAGVDVVVNAAGALQDSARDDLDGVHKAAVVALVECAERSGVRRFVQISAPGATAGASTAFMRTKAVADARVRQSRLDWTILKPGLVIAPQAYGGTALLRLLAGIPLVIPLVHGGAPVQTVALDDVVECVVAAVDGRLAGRELDVVEAEPHSLREVVERFRCWLGLPPARAAIDLPPVLARLVAAGADALGLAGWRSPLRSTALRVIAEGVVGDPGPCRAALGRDARSLEATLAALPATLQERWFAGLALALPLMVATLSAFWLASGVIGLLRMDAAAMVLAGSPVPPGVARALVAAGALVDIALGASVLYRPWARRACYAMLAVSAGYLLAGTALTPALWLDPLGPFVKVIPAALLAWVTSLVLVER